MALNTYQDYFDLAYDTEKWWREHVKMMNLRHIPKCKGYDFRGTMDDMTYYVDVKFHRTVYNVKGWMEVMTNGKFTGIVQTAVDNYTNENVAVYIVFVHEGKWHLHDVKEMIKLHFTKGLDLIAGTSKSDMYEEKSNKHWILNGFSDPRTLVVEGPMRLELWQPMTQTGRAFDMKNWIKGV